MQQTEHDNESDTREKKKKNAHSKIETSTHMEINTHTINFIVMETNGDIRVIVLLIHSK